MSNEISRLPVALFSLYDMSISQVHLLSRIQITIANKSITPKQMLGQFYVLTCNNITEINNLKFLTEKWSRGFGFLAGFCPF